MERGKDAIVLMHKCIEIEPRKAWPYAQLGVALTEIGQFDEAIAVLRKALELESGDAAAHAALGKALNANGRTEDAIAVLDKAIELDPSMPSRTAISAPSSTRVGQRPKPSPCCKRRCNSIPRIAALISWSAPYLPSKASSTPPCPLRKVAELAPEDAAAFSNLGVALNEKELCAEAIPALTRALELEPKNIPIIFNSRSPWARPASLPMRSCSCAKRPPWSRRPLPSI